MKKLVLYLCVGGLALGLAGCGTGGGEDSGSQDAASPEQSIESDSQGGEEGGESTGETVPGSGAAEGDQIPETQEGWSEEMQGLRDAVTEALGQENYWPDMPVDAEMLEMFYGITSDMYEDYMAETPMISTNVDTLMIIRAKEDRADAVEEALNAYREANVSDTMQYPYNLGKIQASQVERMGSYVVFVQLGGFAVDAETEEEVLTQCQEANKLALDTIREKLDQGDSL